jgi:hypothetical protein
MTYTIECYNENESCEECGNKPVRFLCSDNLTGKKVIKLCYSCFKKKSINENLNKKTTE